MTQESSIKLIKVSEIFFRLTVLGELTELLFHRQFPTIEDELKHVEKVEIDLRQCHWADPVPLLNFGLLIGELGTRRIEVTVRIPDVNSSKNYQKFLKFIVREGFLDLWKLKSCLCIGSERRLKGAVILYGDGPLSEEMEQDIRSLDVPLLYEKATCVPAILIYLEPISTKGIVDENVIRYLSEIDKLVDGHILKSILSVHRNKLPSWTRRGIQSKLLGVVRELLHNIVEHAYRNANDTQINEGFAALYLRFRDGLLERNQATEKLVLESIGRESQSEEIHRLLTVFIRSCTGFFEGFIVDRGSGISNTLKSPNFLNSTMMSVFSGSSRKKSGTTQFGGLHYIHELLKKSKDFLRVYDKGELWGSVLPAEGINISSNLMTSQYNNSFEVQKNTKGVSWTFRIAPPIDIEAKELGANWLSIDSNIRHEAQRIYENSRLDLLSKNLGLFVNSPFSDNSQSICDTAIYLPKEPKGKNSIQRDIKKAVSKIESQNLTLIIGEIGNQDAISFLLAIERAPYFVDTEELKYVTKIVLIIKSLSVLVLTRNANSLFTASLQDTEAYISSPLRELPSDSFLGYFYAIREYDSATFWLALGLSEHNTKKCQLSPCLKCNPVTWTNRIQLTHYLDFGQALATNECMEVCIDAIERLDSIQNDKPRYYRGINQSIESLLYRFYATHRPKQRKTQVLIGSIAVTGSTGRSVRDGSGEIVYLLKHPNGTCNESALLMWPVLANTDAYPIYQRVGNSDHIALRGWKSFRLPRYEGEKSIYVADPPETYRAFQDPARQLMKLGHWQYGKHHDFIGINTLLAFDSEVDLISLGAGSGLAMHLFDAFYNLFGVKKRHLSPEGLGILNEVQLRKKQDNPLFNFPRGFKNRDKNIIFVYASHAVTDHIVYRFLKTISDNEKHIAVQNRIVPLYQGFGNKTSMHMSGLLHERLEKLIKNSQIPIAVFFDDAQITGRTSIEVENHLRGFGCKNIYKIYALDRQRLSSAHYVVNGEVNAYWRLDVPTMGSSDSCTLCRAIGLSSELQTAIVTKRHLKRIADWNQAWKSRNPLVYWGQSGLESVPVELRNPKKHFAYYATNIIDKSESLDKKRIAIHNSTGIALWATELQAMTGRDDLVTRMIDLNSSRFEKLDNETIMQIICTQLLLFPDTTNRDLRASLVERLLFLSSERKRNDRYTSLCALVLLTQLDANLGPSIKRLRSHIDFSKLNDDLKVFFAYLHLRIPKSLNYEDLYPEAVELLRPNNKETLYSRLHLNLKDAEGTSHTAPIQRLIRSGNDYSAYRVRGAQLLDSINQLQSVFLATEFSYFSRPIHAIGADRVVETVKEGLIQLRDIEQLTSELAEIEKGDLELKMFRIDEKFAELKLKANETVRILDNIYQFVFRPIGLTNLSEGKLSTFQEQMLKFDRYDQLKIEDFDGELDIDFVPISPEKLRSQRDQFKEQYEEVYVLWDYEIRLFVADLIQNLRHTKERRTKPSCDPVLEERIAWISLDIRKNIMRITIENYLLEEKKPGLYDYEEKLRKLAPFGLTPSLETVNNNLLVHVDIVYAHNLREHYK